MKHSAVTKSSQYARPSLAGQSLEEAEAELAYNLGRLQLTAARGKLLLLVDGETVSEPCAKLEREMPKFHSERRLPTNKAKRIGMAGFNGGSPRGDVIGTFFTGTRNNWRAADAPAQLRQLP